MDDRAYTHLVKRFELDSSANPRAFRARVLLVSSSAYVILFSILALLFVAVWFAVQWAMQRNNTFSKIQVGFFVLAVLPLFYAVLRTFFMRLKAPEGRTLTREDAPRLFKTLDTLRSNLGGPKIHHVLIDREYNAAISQVPRFGLFGGHVNYLILGLPYLIGSTPKETLATIAHEYGHLCGGHGKTGAWIYRQRRVFGALYAHVSTSAEDNVVDKFIHASLVKFMPYYSACTFVLARQDEYEADRMAARVAGANAIVDGLTRSALLGRWMHEDFWPKLYKQADTSLHPSFLPFKSMRTAFKAGHVLWATQERLSAAWMERADLHDTHPSLRDRVEATGQTARLPAPVDVNAADAILGTTLTKQLVDEFDRHWWREEKTEWEARCKYATRSRARLAELRNRAMQSLPVHELQELALLTAEFDTPHAARPVLEHLLRQAGGPYPRAAFVLGCILLDTDERHGLDYLEQAATADPGWVREAAYRGYDYLMRTQDDMAAARWWDRITGLLDDDEDE